MSRDTAIRVIETLDLAALPEFNPDLRTEFDALAAEGGVPSRAASAPPTLPPAPADSLEAVIPEFLAGLDVAREPSSDVVRIGFRSLDPDLAAAVPEHAAPRLPRPAPGAPRRRGRPGARLDRPAHRRAARPHRRRDAGPSRTIAARPG